MTNDALNKLQQQREASKESLKKTMVGLKGLSPMSVITGQVNLDGLMAQIESALHLNDQVISELVSRELNRDQAELTEMIGG